MKYGLRKSLKAKNTIMDETTFQNESSPLELKLKINIKGSECFADYNKLNLS